MISLNVFEAAIFSGGATLLLGDSATVSFRSTHSRSACRAAGEVVHRVLLYLACYWRKGIMKSVLLSAFCLRPDKKRFRA